MRTLFKLRRSALLLCVAGAAACTGQLGTRPDPGSSQGSGASGGGDPGGSTGSGGQSTADPLAAGTFVLRHLSQREYLNTVRDLLADTTLAAGDVPGESPDPEFAFPQPGVVDKFNAGLYQAAAEKLASNAAAHLDTLLPCSAKSIGEAQCAAQFVSEFGKKAYRRPLAADEIATLTGVYTSGRTDLALDFNGGIVLLIETMLQSPGFLYHWEVAPTPAVMEGAVVKLDPYTMASRLSYFVWGTMPDQALFDAAASQKLAAADDVAAQVRRMLKDDRARDAVATFFDQWLDIPSLATRPKDTTLYPQFLAPLKSAMQSEVHSFVNGIVFDGTGELNELLTGTSSYANQTLAQVYGVSGPKTDALEPVSLNPAERSGLLTSAGFLTVTGAANGSHPVRRGKAIYTRLLCGVVPPPPPNVPPPAAASAGGTTRQRFEVHDQQACAKGCHTLMDPLGFAFEHYDGIGEFRTTDNGLPVDSTTTVTVDGKAHAVADARELSQVLAESDEVHACFAKQWLRYATGRMDTSADQASLDAAGAAFKSEGENVVELIVGLASSRTFRYRTPSAGEVIQ